MPETATVPVIDPTTQTPQAPVRRDILTRITPERSRAMAERRKQLQAERLELAAKNEQQAEEIALLRLSEPDPFYSKTLTRVRKQISKLLTLMESEEDGGKHDRLASAIAKLEEIDRRFSDRSLPAVRRVQDQGKPSRASSLLGD